MEERLQKVLAKAGLASRREAEKIITAGRVKVNGKVVTELGTKVRINKDKITVDNEPIKKEKMVYLLFNKPKGVMTTLADPEGRKTVADFVDKIKERVFPVGRLDYNTEGLLILTNDGNLSQQLTHPKHHVNKTYLAKVVGIVSQEKLDQLRIGVQLEDGMTAPAIVEVLEYEHEKNITSFRIIIHEGRNRQIRRMCDFIGHPVRSLARIKFANLTLSGLGKGKYRFLEEAEVIALYKSSAMEENDDE